MNPSLVRVSIVTYCLMMLFACGGSGGSGGSSTPPPVPTNTAPIANAGPDQNVIAGGLVTLNGTASTDADGDALSYLWTQVSAPAGSNASLSSATSAMPTFTADTAGSYTYQLVVNDGTLSSAADTVTVIGQAANSTPMANAGSDQSVPTGTLVTLDASASSDADGDLLTYDWSLTSVPAGSTAALSSSTSVRPSFTVDVDGDYIAQLIVSDGTASSAASTVTVNATSANTRPVADAGANQNVVTGSTVMLDGSDSSDADGDALSFQWSLASVPAGSQAALNNTDAMTAEFTADLDGNYVAQLVVNDGSESSVADTVTVTAATGNSRPVANAGPDQLVVVGTIVSLDGGGSSDADGDGLSYQWSFQSLPAGSAATLDVATAVNPGFTADIEGSYVLRLVVNDGFADSDPDTVVVNVSPPRLRIFLEAGGLSSGTFNEVAMPYASASTRNVNVTGVPQPTTYVLNRFRLRAEGQDFTLIDLIAIDASSLVTPFYSGISEGFVVRNGTEVEFELVTPLTGGATVNPGFGLEVQETGDTFSAIYVFTSN